MGCCLSSSKSTSPAPHPSSKSGHRYDFEPPKFLKSTAAESRAPPPDYAEETVKEVLSSETPNKPPPNAPPEEKREIQVEKLVAEEEDASEVCSASEVSAATTANDEEVAMVKQGKGSRRYSPAGVVGRSPTKRSNNYSGGGQVRMVRQSRESGPHVVAGRRAVRSEPSRRDPGDISARRSRSPATQRSTVGSGSRNGSVKRANPSPGRVRKDPAEEGRKPGAATHRFNNDEEDAMAANESLENPLVSLECFIFL